MNEWERGRVAVEVNGIGKAYRDGDRLLQILKDVSFSIHAGEGVAILGPSGCGKTTLLNIISGLDRPTTGEVSLGGRTLARMNETEKAEFRNRNVGFVFQFYHLLSELTALENVMLPAMMGGRREPLVQIRARAEKLLWRVGLSNRASHFSAELSGGEQQRVAIARALINDPPLVFCDEPTGNLDSAHAQEIAELLADLFRGQGKTLLIVTHDERIAKITDKIWDLASGRWQETPGADGQSKIAARLSEV